MYPICIIYHYTYTDLPLTCYYMYSARDIPVRMYLMYAQRNEKKKLIRIFLYRRILLGHAMVCVCRSGGMRVLVQLKLANKLAGVRARVCMWISYECMCVRVASVGVNSKEEIYQCWESIKSKRSYIIYLLTYIRFNYTFFRCEWITFRVSGTQCNEQIMTFFLFLARLPSSGN